MPCGNICLASYEELKLPWVLQSLFSYAQNSIKRQKCCILKCICIALSCDPVLRYLLQAVHFFPCAVVLEQYTSQRITLLLASARFP